MADTLFFVCFSNGNLLSKKTDLLFEKSRFPVTSKSIFLFLIIYFAFL